MTGIRCIGICLRGERIEAVDIAQAIGISFGE